MDIQSPLHDAQDAPFTIPANNYVNVYGVGEFVRCLDADADFKISFNNGAKAFCGAGIARYMKQGESFSSFQLWNDTGNDIDVLLSWGYGDVKDSRLTVTGNLNIAQASSRTHKAVTVGTDAVELLASNAGRKGWKVTNKGEETIYIGSDDTVTAADGDPVLSGGSFGWDDQAAVYAISETAGQDVRVVEIE